MAKIKEIFTSIQGEGPYVGYKQLFIRFCGCNLKCKYCDTDFSAENAQEYSVEELVKICEQNSDCHSVSLTGGEPLLEADFIKEFALKTNLPIYLETNATLPEQLEKVIHEISYVSADIKLPSALNSSEMWERHDKFFTIASQKVLFAKVVFDKTITDIEIRKVAELAEKYDIELVLQPMMIGKNPAIDSGFMQSILDKFLEKHKKTRLIPQVHKFIDVI